MTFVISKELMEAIVNYLSHRPWVEVAKIMEELLKCQPSTPEQP